ncbi:M1 family metallopeptidase [Terriglobus sp. ADX1]|uniref:M1 family metallopeptidase n=1 Tax=Terriglobus sp. ADX1 TaxID=2794063 RepID=UPI002FE5AA9C
MKYRVSLFFVLFLMACCGSFGQQDVAAAKKMQLLGEYGPYRANNDLLHYTLTVRVNPEDQSIAGDNQVRFRMLEDGQRIQLDLAQELTIDKVLYRGKPVKVTREEESFFVDVPRVMRKGSVQTLDVFYNGHPRKAGRFGGMSYEKDSAGKPWVFTSCEGNGARVWWPNKDQWKDEPQQGVDLHVSAPNGLMDVSNGRLLGHRDLHDGYTQWNWRVTYPINNYDVTLNIGTYVHWNDKPLGKLTIDFYAKPEDLEKAKVQFAQARPMLEIFNKKIGEYAFVRDGYKLVQVPYAGMEHQSAVAYGNGFENSYHGGDWTGVGISPRFDFIIIHESGHEWFGNAITAADPGDMWIHEGWCTYSEDIYVEGRWGKNDAIKYVNGYKKKVKNERPILGPRGTDREPRDEDQYFKGALFLNTLRSVVDDDAKWYAGIHAYYEHFKYKTILTEDVVSFWNQYTGHDLTPIFNEYLRHAALPKLELKFDDAAGTVQYRWDAEEAGFNMPVKVGDPQHWTLLHPTATWQTMPAKRDGFHVAEDLYYIDVVKM